MQALISVIVPAYNAVSYLKNVLKAFNKVITQILRFS